MNINESLSNKLKELRALTEANEADTELADIDDTELDDYDDTADINFGDTAVAAGNIIEIDGTMYEWDKPQSDLTTTPEGSVFQVWSIRNSDLDEVLYLVVDTTDGYIKFGPVTGLEEARKQWEMIEGTTEDSPEVVAEEEPEVIDTYSSNEKDLGESKESRIESSTPVIDIDVLCNNGYELPNPEWIVDSTYDIFGHDYRFEGEDIKATDLNPAESRELTYPDVLDFKEAAFNLYKQEFCDLNDIKVEDLTAADTELLADLISDYVSLPDYEKLYSKFSEIDDNTAAALMPRTEALEVSMVVSEEVKEDLNKILMQESLNEELFIMVPPEGLQVQNTDNIPSPCPACDNANCPPDLGPVIDTATKVMEAYQNANKWMDIIKEYLFTDLACVFFSSYIHELAHTMPVRFDKFGDILHTMDIKIPYPATQYIPNEPQSIDDVFNLTFMILDAIKASLNDFIKITDDNYHGMSCAAEALLNDIEEEYVPLYKLRKAWLTYDGDTIRFDKWVGQYTKEKDNLTESLTEKAKLDKRPQYQIKYSYVDKNGKYRTCYCGTVYNSERDADYALSDALSDLEDSDCTEVSGEVVGLDESLLESDKTTRDYFKLAPEQCEKLFNALKDDVYEVVNEVEADLRKQGLSQKQLYRLESDLMKREHCPIDDLNFYIGEALNEDTIKQDDGTWTNKGDEGTHGEFDTKEKADDQRKAMFANGYKG